MIPKAVNSDNHGFCPACGSTSHSQVDGYRPFISFDKKYINPEFINQCSNCGLCYADPMPGREELNEYYRDVYRAVGRPYEISYSDSIPDFRHSGYISYISHFVDLNSVKNVLEIGPGPGAFGRLLLSLFPHISLYSDEPCSFSNKRLAKIGYRQHDSANRYDLVVATHVLEHFSSVELFFDQVRSSTTSASLIFLEVPNVDFSNPEISKRPYDTPHLLFFTKDSLKRAISSQGYEILNLSTSGNKISEINGLASNWADRYRDWLPNRREKASGFGWTYFTESLTHLTLYLRGVISVIRRSRLERLTYDTRQMCSLGSDSWQLRAIVKQSSCK